MNTEKIARLMAEALEDTNCPNPKGHWDGSGGMHEYSQEKKEDFRKVARIIPALLKDANNWGEAYILPALAIGVHSAGNFCNSQSPEDAAIADDMCIEVAMALQNAFHKGELE